MKLKNIFWPQSGGFLSGTLTVFGPIYSRVTLYFIHFRQVIVGLKHLFPSYKALATFTGYPGYPAFSCLRSTVDRHKFNNLATNSTTFAAFVLDAEHCHVKYK